MLQLQRQTKAITFEESSLLQEQPETSLQASTDAEPQYLEQRKARHSTLISQNDEPPRGTDENLHDAVDRFKAENVATSKECTANLKEAKKLLNGLHKRVV